MRFLAALSLLISSVGWSQGITIPSINKRDLPIVIEHEVGAKVEAIFARVSGGAIVWETLSDEHFVRRDSETIMVAPAGEYVITTGESTIIKVVDEGRPDPQPNPGPSPNPSPGPEPPEPDPEPAPVVDGLVWAIVFEQTSDRSQIPGFAELMASGYLQDLDAKPDFEFVAYDIDSSDAKRRRSYYAGVELPALVLVKADGTKLDARTIRNADEMKAAIKEVTGRE